MTTHAVPKLYPVTVSVDHTLAVKHAAKVAATSPAAKAAQVAKAEGDASTYASNAKGLAKS